MATTALARVNTTSKEYTGTTVFDANLGRSYLFIVVLSGTATVAFGGGDGQVPLPTIGSWYEPLIVPTGEFTVTTGDPADRFVVHSDDQA